MGVIGYIVSIPVFCDSGFTLPRLWRSLVEGLVRWRPGGSELGPLTPRNTITYARSRGGRAKLEADRACDPRPDVSVPLLVSWLFSAKTCGVKLPSDDVGANDYSPVLSAVRRPTVRRWPGRWPRSSCRWSDLLGRWPDRRVAGLILLQSVCCLVSHPLDEGLPGLSADRFHRPAGNALLIGVNLAFLLPARLTRDAPHPAGSARRAGCCDNSHHHRLRRRSAVLRSNIKPVVSASGDRRRGSGFPSCWRRDQTPRARRSR